MGVPTSEVGYNSAMLRREDHEVIGEREREREKKLYKYKDSMGNAQ